MLFTFYLVDKKTNRKTVKKHLTEEEAQTLYYVAVAIYFNVDNFTEEEYDGICEGEDALDGEMRGYFGINDTNGGYFAEDDILEKHYTKVYGL